MNSIQLFVFLLSAVFLAAAAPEIKLKSSVTVPPQPVFHATNRTRVPSVHHIIDAVETLNQAYSVFTDDNARATVWAQLFQEKHPENEWNVIVGYSASYITSKYYVEVDGGSVASTDKNKPATSKYYLLFSVASTTV